MSDFKLFDSSLFEPSEENRLENYFKTIGFQNFQAVQTVFHRMEKDPTLRSHLQSLMPYLATFLGAAGNPDRVIASLDRLIQNSEGADNLLAKLAENPRRLEILTHLFSGSQFLTDILLRHPVYLDSILALNHLTYIKSADEFYHEARQAINHISSIAEVYQALRGYQHQELFRIGICDLLGLLDINAVTRQLSGLADGVVEVCLQQVAHKMGLGLKDFVVIGLGKLGGEELNYSSDIDLLFIARSEPFRYLELGTELIRAIAGFTEDGFLYRVDLRLRPWGSVGPLVSSLQGYMKYLQNNARLWERQALLKARIVAGDVELGQIFLEQIHPMIFGLPSDLVRASVYELKIRTETILRSQGREYGEIKLGLGSIRDIEFVVQYLQLAFGAQYPQVRSRNTLQALEALQNSGLLHIDDARILMDGYIFLRVIEHYLQLNEYRQTHQLPTQPGALTELARRLGFKSDNGSADLMARYLQHSAAIRSVFLRYLGNEVMQDKEVKSNSNEKTSTQIRQHIQRMDPSYTQTFSQEEIQQHAEMASCLDSDQLVVVNAKQIEDGRWRVTIVAYDYLGELSLICGLMFVYGLNIHGGEVFTYESSGSLQNSRENRKKIVDVFTVQPGKGDISATMWDQYATDLSDLLRWMDQGKRRLARGELAKRVAAIFQDTTIERTPLYPIDIEVENEISDRYTILMIDSVDTIGFLYELTNALAYSQIYIARVTIDTIGNRVRDILYVTDEKGRKLTDPKRLRELRAAIVLIKHFTHLLPHSPNPESALLHFRDFIAQLFERPNWPDELASLEKPQVLHGLARLLGVSDFLWDDFLRLQYANLFPVVRDVDALNSAKSRAQLQSELEAGLLTVHAGPQLPSEDAPWITYLNQFKDREMFRIDMRHIVGHTKEFWDFAKELTDLSEVVVNAAYHLAAEDLRTLYGTPLLENGEISHMAVLALGKCGGRELGFASDIELMFIYEGNGVTSGPEMLTSAEFHEKTVQWFIKAIHARREGIFQIDLQLRPYGNAGSLAVSLEAFKRYFSPAGPAWAYERQALVKLRPIAGDENLGKLIVALRDEYVYTGAPFDVTAMRAMRERQLRHQVVAGKFHPKYSPGGLVDIEYLIQALQITHGAIYPELRTTNTRQAMRILNDLGILSDEDYVKLRKAHTFLRWLIDSLRVVRGNVKDIHVPSPESEEFSFLARRLQFGSDLNRLQEDLITHPANVLDINKRLLGYNNLRPPV